MVLTAMPNMPHVRDPDIQSGSAMTQHYMPQQQYATGLVHDPTQPRSSMDMDYGSFDQGNCGPLMGSTQPNNVFAFDSNHHVTRLDPLVNMAVTDPSSMHLFSSASQQSSMFATAGPNMMSTGINMAPHVPGSFGPLTLRYNQMMSQDLLQDNAPWHVDDQPIPGHLMQAAFGHARRTSMPSPRSDPPTLSYDSNSPYSPVESGHFCIKSEEGLHSMPSSHHGSISFPYQPDFSSGEPEENDKVLPTDVDALMQVVQNKSGHSTKILKGNSRPDSSSPERSKRKYTCPFSDCRKVFFQKTHLEIHVRSHTGDKPFVCKERACGQRFSQLGNLKTHERRHTGERPFRCPVCGKAFAQRGNVNAHKIVHSSSKPFTCKLDACGKNFTQLGNLKSHQNKFHADTIRALSERFAGGSETASPHDAEMWEYFTGLYKNCNKGIKGRGKDRRINMTAAPAPLLPKEENRRDSIVSEEGDAYVPSVGVGVMDEYPLDPNPHAGFDPAAWMYQAMG